MRREEREGITSFDLPPSPERLERRRPTQSPFSGNDDPPSPLKLPHFLPPFIPSRRPQHLTKLPQHPHRPPSRRFNLITPQPNENRGSFERFEIFFEGDAEDPLDYYGREIEVADVRIEALMVSSVRLQG